MQPFWYASSYYFTIKLQQEKLQNNVVVANKLRLDNFISQLLAFFHASSSILLFLPAAGKLDTCMNVLLKTTRMLFKFLFPIENSRTTVTYHLTNENRQSILAVVNIWHNRTYGLLLRLNKKYNVSVICFFLWWVISYPKILLPSLSAAEPNM